MRSIVVFVAFVITAVFAVMNWSTFVAPIALSIGPRTIEAPLGVVMLGLMALLTLGFVIYILSVHASALGETRRLTRELQAQRDLADKAEASRFTELREFMRAELLRVSQADDAMRRTLLERMDTLEQHSHAALAESIDGLEHRLEQSKALFMERRH